MDSEGVARVDRLVDWIKRHRREWLNEAGALKDGRTPGRESKWILVGLVAALLGIYGAGIAAVYFENHGRRSTSEEGPAPSSPPPNWQNQQP